MAKKGKDASKNTLTDRWTKQRFPTPTAFLNIASLDCAKTNDNISFVLLFFS
jgi:hypothetical protein